MKVDLYQNMPSIQEILFIDTTIMRVQLYRRETDYWIMRNFANDDRVELASLGMSFSVQEVYEKTTFDRSFAEE
jgi:Uma2 family endonuclease